jgi:DNA primase
MDTIALHEAGFTNTVAVSGTALTEKHIQILKRLTHKIYLCFDGDKAGQNATKSSLETLKNKGLEVRIITLPKGKDPDEIIKSGGDFQKLIDTSNTPIAFYIGHSEVNTESLDDKKKFLQEILSIIKSYSDEIERDSYIKEIAKVLDIPITLIYDELKKIRLKKQEVTRQDTLSYSQEDIAIAHMMSYPETIQEIQESIIFTENMGKDLVKYFENPSSFLDSQEMSKKTLYQSLCLKIEEQTLDEKDTQKIIDNLNREHYRKVSQELKEQMKS